MNEVVGKSLYTMGIQKASVLSDFYSDSVLLFGKQLCIIEEELQKKYMSKLDLNLNKFLRRDETSSRFSETKDGDARIANADESESESAFTRNNVMEIEGGSHDMDVSMDGFHEFLSGSGDTVIHRAAVCAQGEPGKLKSLVVSMRKDNAIRYRKINKLLRSIEKTVSAVYEKPILSAEDNLETPLALPQTEIVEVDDADCRSDGDLISHTRKLTCIVTDDGDTDELPTATGTPSDYKCSESTDVLETATGSFSENVIETPTELKSENGNENANVEDTVVKVRHTIAKAPDSSVLKITTSKVKVDLEKDSAEGKTDVPLKTKTIKEEYGDYVRRSDRKRKTTPQPSQPTKRRSSSRLRSPASQSISESVPSTPADSRNTSPESSTAGPDTRRKIQR